MNQDTTSLAFAKMHGLGNDFVILDTRNGAERMTAALAQAIGDRHTGVGFDQLAEIRPADGADIGLLFWNSDGTRAGACGNATRCVAQRIMAETGRDSVTIETDRGVLIGRMTSQGPSVNMGQPQLTWDQVPLARAVDPVTLPLEGAPTAVGMGNPHAVFFVADADAVDPAGPGPAIECNALFPQGTNVEFATALTSDRVRMRVWERGAGITRACGSGACATVVAGHLRGLLDRRAVVDLDGGALLIDWREDGVWMTGATAHVFDGVLGADWLADV